MKKATGPFSVAESHSPPPHYEPQPSYDKMTQERDAMVPMRDGVHLCVDIYRPDAPGKFPALLAWAGALNKDMQSPEACEACGPHPDWAPLWYGTQEAGDTRYLVSRGYVHVIADARGTGKSEDGDSPQGGGGPPDMGGPPGGANAPGAWDQYDLIEWIAQQPWCDGNIGMIGISGFGVAQWQTAMQQPPHLKAIFPYDPGGAYGFHDHHPGGVICSFPYMLAGRIIPHEARGRPGTLPPEQERLWEEAMNNPDYRMYSHFYNVLTQKGQTSRMFFNTLLNPFAREGDVKRFQDNFDKIKVPAYTGTGWYAYLYKNHLQGCQNWYNGVKVPKKLLFTGPAHLERPFHQFHDEILRWYDYWLKGIDTGIMDEPPVKMWVMGANEWRYADDWPLPETKWTKFYLHNWERMREEPFIPSSRDACEEPDAFVQMPLSQTMTVQRLRYMTDPLPEDMLVIGPSALHLYASIDQEDTNWIIILKDVGPDVSVRTAKKEEREIPANLPEREVVRGWLKASHRALDTERSKPGKPWHPLTREAWKPVVPGEINEYAIEILSTANLFEKGHRICVDITSMDVPTGTGGFTDIAYIPYHLCSSKTTVHKIYHNEKYPSFLLLPIIPKEASV